MKNIHDESNQAILDAIANANLFVRREYLQCLDQAQVMWKKDLHDVESMRLLHIQTILYDREESIANQLKVLFSAVENYGESVVLIVNGKKDRAEFYLGISSQQPPQPVYATFQRSLRGVLPGCQFRALHNKAIHDLMNDLLPEDEDIHISAISAFPSEESEQNNRYEKLDALIDSLRHQPFSLFLIAKAIPSDELTAMVQQLQRLYTELSSMERSVVTFSESDTDVIGQNFSKAVIDSLSCNASISRGKTFSEGHGFNIQQLPDNIDLKKQQSTMQMVGTAAALLLPGALGQESTNVLQSLFYGSSITNVLNSGMNLLGGAPQEAQPTVTISQHQDKSVNAGQQIGQAVSQATNTQQGLNVSINKTSGETRQMTRINKNISGLLELLEKQIRQIESFRQEGAFNTAAYFIAGDSETAISAANLFRSISASAGRPTLLSPICSWHGTSEVMRIMRYLRCGQHPEFTFPEREQFPRVQVAQMIGLSDMPHYFSLPERSVPGLVVSSSARFSRDVITQRQKEKGDKKCIHIGYHHHMGKTDRMMPINLSVNDLTKHLFVAGATGVGKSNFCYQLLDALDQQGIRMLIIEPAKGEYRHVFGGREGFHVFGVDPHTSPVLRINPFAFPEGISAIQHIERLLDIFNTAWPMYSAMPAILKEAVETIYVEKGFDLIDGRRPEEVEFPSFQDLLEALPKVINQSCYSGEVKGNYTGALVTRVRSLTNGLYGIIFGVDEIGDEMLFSSNTIADISRIGSMETKALLMGVLTMRLMEYRMAEGLVNAPLRHVTVLEEAHNLLRRQNMSSVEGGNMRAASVEMLASAIAEMRTYGEGFIIADQSPSVMDWSVIRNTQTKVFFMLPDREDRAIAANALSLTDAQQQELARLESGIAVVYQNGWADPTLCKINFFDSSRQRPFVFQPKSGRIDCRVLVSQAAAKVLKRRITTGQSSINQACVDQMLQYDKYLLTQEGKQALSILKGDAKSDETLADDYRLLNRLLPIGQILRSAGNSSDIIKWAEEVESKVEKYVSLTNDEMKTLVALGLREWNMHEPKVKLLYVRYLAYKLK